MFLLLYIQQVPLENHCFSSRIKLTTHFSGVRLIKVADVTASGLKSHDYGFIRQKNIRHKLI
jgi:hypothetical protein